MNKKILYKLGVLFVLLSMALGACTTPTAAPVATEEAAATEAPVELLKRRLPPKNRLQLKNLRKNHIFYGAKNSARLLLPLLIARSLLTVSSKVEMHLLTIWFHRDIPMLPKRF